MHCKNCGKEVNERAAVCPNCGVALNEQTAPAASADSESSNRYARCRAACAAPGERPVFPRALTLQTLPEQGSGSRTKQRRT